MKKLLIITLILALLLCACGSRASQPPEPQMPDWLEKQPEPEPAPEAAEPEPAPEPAPEATPEPAPETSRYPDITLTDEERNLIAKLICMEAASEPFDGQQAVAEVVLNRLVSGDFPDTITEVIYEKEQFRSVPYLYL